MATRNAQTSMLQYGVSETLWEGLLNTDDGSPFSDGALGDKCVHVFGTFGVGGAILVEGGNNGTTFKTLTDPQGAAVSFTAEGVKQIIENPKWIRPRVTGGDGTTDLDVIILSRGSR